MTALRIAIVVPTLNEEPALRDHLPPAVAVADELVVSDGGSTDGTRALAAELGALVVTGQPGRGLQLNRGARATEAEILLFLHADTKLPPDALEQVHREIASGAAGGGFLVRFDSNRPIRRLGEHLVNLRTKLTRCPLGDQAQFASRSAFEALGGYREWPILEDLDFARRLKKHGHVALLSPPVTTSARRFDKRGTAATVATNWLIWLLYFLGVSPLRLARLYRHVR